MDHPPPDERDRPEDEEPDGRRTRMKTEKAEAASVQSSSSVLGSSSSGVSSSNSNGSSGTYHGLCTDDEMCDVLDDFELPWKKLTYNTNSSAHKPTRMGRPMQTPPRLLQPRSLMNKPAAAAAAPTSSSSAVPATPATPPMAQQLPATPIIPPELPPAVAMTPNSPAVPLAQLDPQDPTGMNLSLSLDENSQVDRVSRRLSLHDESMEGEASGIADESSQNDRDQQPIDMEDDGNIEVDTIPASAPQNASPLRMTPIGRRVVAQPLGPEDVDMNDADLVASWQTNSTPSIQPPASGLSFPTDESDILFSQFTREERVSAMAEDMPAWEIAFNKLNDEQKQAVLAFQEQDNVFLTGGAGTGKTFVLRTITEWLKFRYPRQCMARGGTAPRPQPSVQEPLHEDEEEKSVAEGINAPAPAASSSAAVGIAATSSSDTAPHSASAPCQCESYGCSVAIIGPTGLCVLDLRGRTLHSFNGIGKGATVGDWDRQPSSMHLRRIRSVKVLLIEEVSMISAEQFDLMDLRWRILREVHDRPFGGAQVLIAGDFAQLPPVQKSDIQTAEGPKKYDAPYVKFRDAYDQLMKEHFPDRDNITETFAIFRRHAIPAPQPNKMVSHEDNAKGKAIEAVTNLYHALPVRQIGFAYQSNAWKELNLTPVLLNVPMRFSSDPQSRFPVWLNELKRNVLHSIREFDCRVVQPGASIPDCVHLMFKNKSVEDHNGLKLDELLKGKPPDELKIFRAQTLRTLVYDADRQDPNRPPETDAQLLARAEVLKGADAEMDELAESTVALATGAPVLLTRNLDMRQEVKVMLANGTRGVITGWALAKEVIDAKVEFITNIEAKIARHERQANQPGLVWKRKKLESEIIFFEKFKDQLPEYYPIVTFTGTTIDPMTNMLVTREEVMTPHISDSKDSYNTEKQVTTHKWRFQLPLKLGWACTIHKSQGMSLDAAYIANDGRAFANGMIYVALSRVRTFDKIFLARKLDHHHGNLWANSSVCEFYEQLEAQHQHSQQHHHHGNDEQLTQEVNRKIDWLFTPTAELMTQLK